MKKDSIKDFSPEAVIIDAGVLPTDERAVRWLDGCRRIVCCDGAADSFIASGGIPWRIVGDCDSLSPSVMNNYSEIVRRFPDQDTNDQTKAVKYLVSKGVRRIVILGATGKREDHTIGNISLLIEYLRHGVEARIYTDHGVFIPLEDMKEFVCTPGSQVSIFNFGATDITSEGLRYPLRDFSAWWEGTLNETLSSTFVLRARGYLLVFIAY